MPRVREGGEVLDRIELDRPPYACMLGGEDGRTLFLVAQKWFGPDRMDELIRARTGKVFTAPGGRAARRLAMKLCSGIPEFAVSGFLCRI